MVHHISNPTTEAKTLITNEEINPRGAWNTLIPPMDGVAEPLELLLARSNDRIM